MQESLSQYVPSQSVCVCARVCTITQMFVSRSSVDFVAPSQNSFSEAPFIVPSSPTGPEREHGEFLQRVSIF